MLSKSLLRRLGRIGQIRAIHTVSLFPYDEIKRLLENDSPIKLSEKLVNFWHSQPKPEKELSAANGNSSNFALLKVITDAYQRDIQTALRILSYIHGNNAPEVTEGIFSLLQNNINHKNFNEINYCLKYLIEHDVSVDKETCYEVVSMLCRDCEIEHLKESLKLIKIDSNVLRLIAEPLIVSGHLKLYSIYFMQFLGRSRESIEPIEIASLLQDIVRCRLRRVLTNQALSRSETTALENIQVALLRYVKSTWQISSFHGFMRELNDFVMSNDYGETSYDAYVQYIMDTVHTYLLLDHDLKREISGLAADQSDFIGEDVDDDEYAEDFDDGSEEFCSEDEIGSDLTVADIREQVTDGANSTKFLGEHRGIAQHDANSSQALNHHQLIFPHALWTPQFKIEDITSELQNERAHRISLFHNELFPGAVDADGMYLTARGKDEQLIENFMRNHFLQFDRSEKNDNYLEEDELEIDFEDSDEDSDGIEFSDFEEFEENNNNTLFTAKLIVPSAESPRRELEFDPFHCNDFSLTHFLERLRAVERQLPSFAGDSDADESETSDDQLQINDISRQMLTTDNSPETCDLKYSENLFDISNVNQTNEKQEPFVRDSLHEYIQQKEAMNIKKKLNPSRNIKGGYIASDDDRLNKIPTNMSSSGSDSKVDDLSIRDK